MIKLEYSLKLILVSQLVMFITIVFDIPIARQVFSFVCISFVPGFLILKIIRINVKDRIDIFLFSIGLSIAFLMFVGLFINELYPLLGISQPLSTIPLTITLIGLILALLFVNYKQNLPDMNANRIMESKNVSVQVLLLFVLPILSVIGALYVNKTILLLMIIIITLLYSSVFSTRTIPLKLCPFIILSISIALILHTSLISKYPLGYDVHLEHYVFKMTELKAHWSKIIPFASLATSNYNSMLSVTILPTIYSFMLKIKDDLILKMIYPLMFSLLPLALYRIYERQTEKMVAFLSVCFFMSNATSFFGVEPLSLCKQQIGGLFLVLSVLVLLYKEMSPRKRTALLMIFGTALVVSHYVLSYFYLFYIIFTFIFLRKRGTKTMLSGSLVSYLVVITFLWNTYVSVSTLKQLSYSFEDIYYRFFLDFFNPESRSSVIASLFTETSTITLVHRILFYLTHIFIAIGIIKLILKPKETSFDPEYRSIAILSMFIISLCLVIPHLGPVIQLSRIRSITLLSLAPFFTLGGKSFFSMIGKTRTFFSNKMKKGSHKGVKWDLRLVSVVLIVFFLFQVGFVNHVTDDKPISYSLDISRMKTTNNPEVKIYFYDAYTPEQDVFSAIWLSKNVKETSLIYSDLGSRHHVLTSYALIEYGRVSVLSNSTTLWRGAYIYLRHLNVVKGLATTKVGFFNVSEISSLLNENNRIYSNGDSEIYCKPGN